jgi:hypothetical protein
MRQAMPTTRRKPASVGDILVEDFLKPMSLRQASWPKRWAFSGCRKPTD